MELVELVFPAARRRATTRARTRALCEALGKTAVEVPDMPGFVVNRLLFPYLFDAVRAARGDRAGARGGRHLHEARRRATRWARSRCSTSSASTSRSRDRRARSAPTSRARVDALVAEGALGRKSGARLLRLLTSATAIFSDALRSQVGITPGLRRTVPLIAPLLQKHFAAGSLPEPAASCSLGRSSPGSPSLLLNRRSGRSVRGNVARRTRLCNSRTWFAIRNRRRLRSQPTVGARGCAPPRCGSRAPTRRGSSSRCG